MNKTISAAEANRQFSRVLKEVRGGTTYIVTSHGEPVARILPPTTSAVEQKELAKQRLLDHLKKQPVLNLGLWSRDEAYDDDL